MTIKSFSKFRHMVHLVFLVFFHLTFLLPTLSLSQEEDSLKLILFSSSDCVACQSAKKYLLDEKVENGVIEFFYEGEKKAIPLKVIDTFYLSKKEIKGLGLQNIPKIPYLGLFDRNPFLSNQLFLIKGHTLSDFSETDHGLLKERGKELGQNYFHIREGENLDRYKERMNQFLEVNVPLIERIIQKGIEDPTHNKIIGNHQEFDPYPLSLEIGQNLKMSQKELLKQNIIFIGNADNPFNNPLFTPMVIDTIKSELETNLKFDHTTKSITLFGSGYEEARDVFKINEYQQAQLVSRPPINGIHGSFNRKNLSKLFQSSDKSGQTGKKRRRLFIMVGHGAKEGALLWFEKEKLKKNELKALHIQSRSTNVLVSGTCYGGQFYDSLTCGFFGAHPKTPAVGCWAYEDHIISKTDYTRTFFSSLNKENRRKADFNSDGDLTLEEMHWFALLNGPKEDIPFTSIDGLARRFLKTYQKPFKELKQIKNYEDLLNYANSSEKGVLSALTKDLKSLEKINFQETKIKRLKTKSGINLSFKINNLNPFDSESIFQLSNFDRQKIKKVIKNQMQRKFNSGIRHISFKKIGPKILYRVFFRSGGKIKFYDKIKWTPERNLKGSFFEINLSEKQREQFLNTKYRKFLTSNNFKLIPKKWKRVKKEYTTPQLLKEFMRVGEGGDLITIGIKYKNNLDPWPKIKILGTIRNKTPKYRMVLPQLIKRLFFKKVVKDYPFYFSKFKSFQNCEQQKIKDFLN